MSAHGSLRRLAFRVAVSDRLEHAVTGVPPLRSLALRLTGRYLGGPDEKAALAVAAALAGEGMAASVDFFGEGVDDRAAAERATARYLDLVARVGSLPGTDVSLDCSHLGLDGEPRRCAARVCEIAAALPPGARLQIGAEESFRTDRVLEVLATASGRGLPVMATVQANLRRSATDLEWLIERAVPVRLVKGAYAEPGHLAHSWGEATDAAYASLADRLAASGLEYALATHDPALIERRGDAPLEFLLGVRSEQARRLAARGRAVRIYVPFGPRWFRYGARRLAEALGS